MFKSQGKFFLKNQGEFFLKRELTKCGFSSIIDEYVYIRLSVSGFNVKP